MPIAEMCRSRAFRGKLDTIWTGINLILGEGLAPVLSSVRELAGKLPRESSSSHMDKQRLKKRTPTNRSRAYYMMLRKTAILLGAKLQWSF